MSDDVAADNLLREFVQRADLLTYALDQGLMRPGTHLSIDIDLVARAKAHLSRKYEDTDVAVARASIDLLGAAYHHLPEYRDGIAAIDRIAARLKSK